MTTVQTSISTVSQRSPISPRQIAFILLASDVIGLFFCATFTIWFRLEEILDLTSPIVYLFGITTLLGLYLANAYRPYENIAGLWSPSRIVIANGLLAIVISASLYLANAWKLSPLTWRSVFLPALFLFTIWAVVSRQLVVTKLKAHARKTSWLLIGTGKLAEQFRDDFSSLNPYGKLSILDGYREPLLYKSGNTGNAAIVENWIETLADGYSGIIIHPEVNLLDGQMRQLMQLRLKGTAICQLPDFYEAWWQRIPPATLQDIWFTFGSGFDLVTGRFSVRVKRVVDIFAASLMLLMLSPVMLLAAIAVKLDSPGPIFYSQMRNGCNRKPFWVYKFRSMYQDAEKRGAQWAQEGDPRITRVGYFLRMTRIDELPQIWNVLIGEMSLIGPRPERPQFDEHLAEVIPYYNLRYLVKPGITGWAQVMYPYGASVEDSYAKVSYDFYYIKNYSIWLDLAIVFKTMRVVLLGKGR
jgi:exopolysaccharide biosynthesis polyprenyl glycosylphosphotransferase